MECQNNAVDTGTGTLPCLPQNHRHGLIAVGTAASVSFTSTTTLFLFLSYKLTTGILLRLRQSTTQGVVGDEIAFARQDHRSPLRDSLSQQLGSDTKTTTISLAKSEEKARNPFPILIYNLLLAEMQATLGYTLNIVWVARNGIFEGTWTCWAQGWLNNIGILTSSMFLTTISINTYLSIVHGIRLPQWGIHVWIAVCWISTLVLTSAGVILTDNGAAEGGWFVRANTWVRNPPTPTLGWLW